VKDDENGTLIGEIERRGLSGDWDLKP